MRERRDNTSAIKVLVCQLCRLSMQADGCWLPGVEHKLLTRRHTWTTQQERTLDAMVPSRIILKATANVDQWHSLQSVVWVCMCAVIPHCGTQPTSARWYEIIGTVIRSCCRLLRWRKCRYNKPYPSRLAIRMREAMCFVTQSLSAGGKVRNCSYLGIVCVNCTQFLNLFRQRTRFSQRLNPWPRPGVKARHGFILIIVDALNLKC